MANEEGGFQNVFLDESDNYRPSGFKYWTEDTLLPIKWQGSGEGRFLVDVGAGVGGGGLRVITSSGPDKRVMSHPLDSTVSLDSSGNIVAEYSPGLYFNYSCLSDGTYLYAAGDVDNGVTGNNHTILKYNISNGDVEWEYNTGGYVEQMVFDNAGNNIFVTGERNNNIDSTYRSMWKLSTAGVLQWGIDTSTGTLGIAVDSSDNIYVAGSDSSTPGLYRISKYNSSGTLQSSWTPFSTNTIISGVATDSTDLYVSGRQAGSVSFKNLVKSDLSGSETWSNTGSQDFWGITLDGSSNVYVGRSDSTAYLYKYNSSGTLQWGAIDSGVRDGYSVEIGPSGNIWVACKVNSKEGIAVVDSSGNLSFIIDQQTPSEDRFFEPTLETVKSLSYDGTYMYCAQGA